MAIIALVPGLLALIVAVRRGPAVAFLSVYLPTLLLTPDYFRWMAPGLPDPTMNEAAILPIAAIFVMRAAGAWRFSWGDLLVGGFAFMTAYTEYNAKNYADAQNLMFDVLCTMVLPYVLTKGMIEVKGLRTVFAKRIVLLLAAVTFISLYEFKMGRPMFRIVLDPFFPGQGSWVTTFRYGFARVAGPYGHAILAGVIFVVGYRIQRWLEWTGHWEGRFRYFRRLTLGQWYTLVMALGTFITLVRGPILGGMVGALVLVVARSRNRRLVAQVVLAGLLIVGVPTGVWFKSYVSVGRAGAKTVSQETAAYRYELIENYMSVAWAHAMWGWGRNAWPKVAGMESTDNNYLLLAMNHGVVALGFFLAIMIVQSVRLGRLGGRLHRDDETGLLAFTLIGCYLSYFVSLATVYHGMQSVQIFFIIAGWAEGLLTYGRGSTAKAAVAIPRPEFAFRRVVA